jgi:hypothetical protein
MRQSVDSRIRGSLMQAAFWNAVGSAAPHRFALLSFARGESLDASRRSRITPVLEKAPSPLRFTAQSKVLGEWCFRENKFVRESSG